MVGCRLEGETLHVREGLGRRATLELPRLRLVYLVARTSLRWFVVTSSQGLAFIDLDGSDEERAREVDGLLAELLAGRRATGCSLALADYRGGSASFPVEAARRGAADLAEALKSTRPARRALRQRWLEGSPRVELRGGFGATATLTPTGFESKKRFIPWSEVGAVHVETTNGLRTDLLVLPHGRRGGIFDLRRFKHSLAFVPGRRKEVYQAECNFWLSRAAAARGPTMGDLVDQRPAAS